MFMWGGGGGGGVSLKFGIVMAGPALIHFANNLRECYPLLALRTQHTRAFGIFIGTEP